MKYKIQSGIVNQPELSESSKTKTLFVDSPSASRKHIHGADALMHGDITGACAFLLAKGHSRRLYGIISDVTVTS